MAKEKNVVAFIQARMSSTRLPGKVLAKIVEKPMLWHIVNRLRPSRLIDKIIVGTSTSKKDDVIEEFCKKNKIDFYRGEEKDVLDRIYQATKIFKASAVVRITADCPLVDFTIVDKVIDFFLKNKNTYEYVSNARPQATFPHGLDVEIFSFALLERLWKELDDPFKREWFAPVVFENPKKYRIFCLKNDVDLSHLRLTVDYKEDFILVSYIFEKFYPEKQVFLLEDVLALLEKEPWLMKINKKYIKHKDVGYGN